MLSKLNFVIFGLFLLCSIGCVSDPTTRDEILVFAAVSLVDALKDVSASYENHSSTTITINYGGSQMLAQQIASGAQADLFISAGATPMEFLTTRGIVGSDRIDLLNNKMILVMKSDRSKLDSLDTLRSTDIHRIALANPEFAPAGIYAKQSLLNLGLWQVLEEKLVFSSDVRVALTYVESGNVDAAFVYETDVQKTRGLKILDIVPIESYSPIVYPAALINRSSQKQRSHKFLEFLQSQEALGIFKNHGFHVAEP